MLKRLQQITIILSILTMVSILVPAVVRADAASDACDGVQLLDKSAKCMSTDAADSQGAFSDILKTVINVFSIVVGAVSVIMIIIGGFRYVISGGDSAGTKAGKDTILYAVIGLAVVIFAQTIVRFVITKTTEKPAPPAKKTSLLIKREV